MFDIKENLKKLPDNPGVYMHKDKLGNIIYVGKAISLRNRVRQYFQSSRNMDPRVRSMVSQIAEFEYITVGSEMESLILECNLIKKYRPKYNVLLRDDKTYPYIKVTAEEYPRVMKTRLLKKDGSKYFGPYSDAGAVNKIVDFLNASFELKRCSASSFPEGFRPCLNYHINQCKGICTGLVSKAEYAQSVAGAIEFLNDHNQTVLARLNKKMKEASDAMEYEEAATYRDYIQAAEALAETQRVVMRHNDDADIVVPCKTEEDAYMVIFYVRDGKLIGRESYSLDAVDSVDRGDAEMLSAFITQHYTRMASIPKEILVKDMPSGLPLIEEWMSSQNGSMVSVIVPQKGRKEKLVALAYENALIKLSRDIEKLKRKEERTLGAVEEIARLLGLADIHRMEAYDISNISGFESVGSMVVYEDGRPKPNEYRKFKIRSVEGPNDYASMEEVLTRRFEHGMREIGSGDTDGKFSRFPDLILMDGGRGQVNICRDVLDKLGLDIPVCGMVKDDNHRTRGLYYDNKELPISHASQGFHLITRIQDEAHRFAITFHRDLRGKKQVHSILDDIPGVGPKRRKALMKAFESLEDIKKASLEELGAVDGLNAAAAKSVYDFFHK